MNICKTLLIVSGDTELNPGPSKTPPKCEKYVPNRLNVHVDIHVHVHVLLESKNTMSKGSHWKQKNCNRDKA